MSFVLESNNTKRGKGKNESPTIEEGPKRYVLKCKGAPWTKAERER